MTVSDMARSVQFFSDVLAFRSVSDREFHGEQFDRLTGIHGARGRVVTMTLGDEVIELTEYPTPQGRPAPPDSRSNDLWFQHIAIVVSDMDAAFARLRKFGVNAISTEPQRIPDWNEVAGGIQAFYFRGPDSHPLELIFFPPGKGDPRWQDGTGKLFLGIDHTAIAVNDTETSLQFYRDVLGMKVTGEGLNYGSEQELLSGVPGARVKITGLRAAEGPGIEFLEYLTPRDGRPYPNDARPNDLLHKHIVLGTADAGIFYDRPAAKGMRFISPSVSALEAAGGKKAVMVRDPDGHTLELISP
jgi:catechol 2,3-dioxygenase-like lactoylglutathione lyase family enzyme